MSIFFDSLHERVTELIESADIAVDCYSPFVTTSVFSNLIEKRKSGVVASLVTTWDLSDLLSGYSDIKLFDECKKSGIYLFLNRNLHLKSYVADYRSLLTGSANLTGAGLGLTKKPNLETLVSMQTPEQRYLIFLAKVKRDSILVTDDIHDMFASALNEFPKSDLEVVDRIGAIQAGLNDQLMTSKHFLISALPMSRSIETLFDVLNGNQNHEFEIVASARHDIANFDLESQSFSDISHFRRVLQDRFFDHPFIVALCEFIDRPRRFGSIKEWVQSNCTDVPVPSRRDLTGNVQVLYNWLVDLGDDRYQVTRPKYSELIAPKGWQS